MKEKRSIVIILSFFIIFFCIGLGIFIYSWISESGRRTWEEKFNIGMEFAGKSQRPILLAITRKPCGVEQDTICPDPESIPELEHFILINLTPENPDFKELEYDDRFGRDMEELPQFFLLNSDGEIRGVQSTFPNAKELDRWRKIK